MKYGTPMTLIEQIHTDFLFNKSVKIIINLCHLRAFNHSSDR